jgi:hypothetical protein
MPLQQTSGALSYDAFGGGEANINYIEDAFQVWASVGNGTTRSVIGPDMTQGGLSITKSRDQSAGWRFVDTVRGAGVSLESNSENAQATESTGVTAFSTTGTVIGSDSDYNTNNTLYVDYLFKKQRRFFDVVTYTGNGANRTIAHNLGSVPGCIIIKRTNASEDWQVYHRSLANTQYMELNRTTGAATGATRWNSTTPTDTVFSLGSNISVNSSGSTYIAYIFAHNAGGFGLSGIDNVISCGSYTGNGSTSGPIVTLGYEPQFLIIKNITTTSSWSVVDGIRGMPVNSKDKILLLDSPVSEAGTDEDYISPNATGFRVVSENFNVNRSGNNYIYIAIRRGLMRVPDKGTSVLSVKTYNGTTTSASVTHDVTFDAEINANRDGDTAKFLIVDSLRGSDGVALQTTSTLAEGLYPTYWSRRDQRTMFAPNAFDAWWASSSGVNSHVSYGFVRASNFFDQICFTGSGANKTEPHNLGSPPELWLVKSRSVNNEWVFGSTFLNANEKIVMPSPNGRVTDATVWNNTYPTTNVLSLGTSTTTNGNGNSFVAYLWATVPRVSKVGTYTGNGSSQTINCGFTSGARFVIIIRATASTAQPIYIWDSARGIVAGNDSRMSLTMTSAEVTTLDTIDADGSGFIVNTDTSNVNVNNAVYIYLAIA